MDGEFQGTEAAPEAAPAAPTTDAPPAPAAESAPAPEPEPEEISPGWLDNVDATSPQYEGAPQGPPINDPTYYQQRGQQQRQRKGGIDFSRFVENPEAVLDEFISSRVGPYLGNLIQDQQQVRAYQQQMLRSQASTGQSNTKRAIETAYKQTFNRDGGFKGNKRVRQIVENHLQNRYVAATQSALHGDPQELVLMQNPEYYGAVLALAKHLAGYSGGGPPVLGTAQTERPTARARTDTPELDPDIETALGRMGPGAKDKYIANLKKYGNDIEFG